MSIAILHKGELVFSDGFGKRNELDPFTVETLVPIGSLTKAFTSTAIGELVAEGKMNWDKTPVNKYLPEFELKDKVLMSQLTLVDLLSHRTRIPDVDMYFYKSPVPRKDLIKRLRHVEMNSKLSSKFNYSNTMYAVAGEAAANVMGVSYEDVVREKVINPLGLANTGFSQVEMKERSNHAVGFSAASFEDAQAGTFKAEGLDETYMACAPAAAMYSNVLDLVKWGRTVMKLGQLDGKQVLNRKSVEETLTAHTIVPGPRRMPELALVSTYGLGWGLDSFKGHAFYHHTGVTWGFSSALMIFPDDDLVVAQLFNTRHAELSPYITYYVVDEILGLPKTKEWLIEVAIHRTEETYREFAKRKSGDLPERIPNKPPSHSLPWYVGEFHHPVFGWFSIQLESDSTEGKATESLIFDLWTFKGRLEHYHFNQFVLRLVSLSIDEPFLILFQTGVSGEVVGLVLDSPVGRLEFRKQDIASRSDRS
ncbi:beta-lactamase/transpeptidase-like protein [Mortierella sp. GBAus27b]|nr:hypothetical protein BGX31_004832 [Mortierella sp. GBA43]KAI8363420.1 beta-lactamase/transpeptidase-like protein [Mortierella sp. GBAus27b]